LVKQYYQKHPQEDGWSHDAELITERDACGNDYAVFRLELRHQKKPILVAYSDVQASGVVAFDQAWERATLRLAAKESMA
jgi:helix-turn-helix protein